ESSRTSFATSRLSWRKPPFRVFLTRRSIALDSMVRPQMPYRLRRSADQQTPRPHLALRMAAGLAQKLRAVLVTAGRTRPLFPRSLGGIPSTTLRDGHRSDSQSESGVPASSGQ